MTDTKPPNDEPSNTEDNTESRRIIERVPGMRSGNTMRNVIVAFGYFMLLAMLVSVVSPGGEVDDGFGPEDIDMLWQDNFMVVPEDNEIDVRWTSSV